METRLYAFVIGSEELLYVIEGESMRECYIKAFPLIMEEPELCISFDCPDYRVTKNTEFLK